jgi:hypothetical protein
MLNCMLMLRMPLMLLIMIVMILFLILMPCFHLLVLHIFMVGVYLGAMFIMTLMRLKIHLMAQLCFIVLMMPHMCYIVKMIKLLLEMWGLNARKVRLVFGFQDPM